jgi:tetratricopeptide (TPR) repeat protein
VPDAGIGIAVMCNCDFGSMSNLSKSILDLLWGVEARPVKIMIRYKLMKTILKHGIDAAKDEFYQIKAYQQDMYNISESSLNSLGYSLLKINRTDDAIEMLKLAINEYPESANLYDSIGEFYLKKGDTEHAVLNYKKSLELNPGNLNAAEVLKKLQYS